MNAKNTELLAEDSFFDEGELPECWKWIELGELCTKITDGTHVTPKYIKDGIPFISTTNIDPYLSGFDFSKYKKYISIEDHLELTKRCKPEKGDLLISKCGTIGRTKLVDVDYDFSIFVGLGLIKLKKGVVSGKYLELALNAEIVQKQLEELAPGSTRKTLPINKIGKIKIPLAPHSEQQHIVARVKALLTHINAAYEPIIRVPLIMKKFRQAVLAAACSGRLTYGWGDKSVWKNVDLKSVLINPKEGMRTGPFGSSLKKFEHQTEGIPVWGIENVKNLQFLPHNKIFITQEKAEQLSNYKVRPGDILLTRSGTVGELCVVPNGIPESRISSNLMRIRLNVNILDPKFCCFLLFGSPSVLEQISDSCGGSTRIFIDGKILKSLVIQLPPLAEQHEIVRRVGLLFERADVFDQEVVAASRRCERLTQAVLGKAFRGELR